MGDVSKTTVLVLLVLTVLLSIGGSWVTLDRVSSSTGELGRGIQNPAATGKVNIAIQEAPAPVMATGKVILEIKS